MEAKEILMKKAGFLLTLICILSLTGCGMVASAEEEILQSDTEENTVSVNFDDVATQSEPAEQFCNHLVQFTEQYSIEVSLKTKGKAGIPGVPADWESSERRSPNEKNTTNRNGCP